MQGQHELSVEGVGRRRVAAHPVVRSCLLGRGGQRHRLEIQPDVHLDETFFGQFARPTKMLTKFRRLGTIERRFALVIFQRSRTQIAFVEQQQDDLLVIGQTRCVQRRVSFVVLPVDLRESHLGQQLLNAFDIARRTRLVQFVFFPPVGTAGLEIFFRSHRFLSL